MRDDAFRYFQNYVDDCLGSKDCRSHEKTQLMMQDFVGSHRKTYHKIAGLEIDTDFDKGLFIYFVHNGNEHIIHGIDNGFIDLYPYLFLRFDCRIRNLQKRTLYIGQKQHYPLG
jgi:hypothetical protein